MTTATQSPAYTETGRALYIGFELGEEKWKLGFASGLGDREWVRSIPARDFDRLDQEVRKAKTRFGLPSDCSVRSCYEAGRDGFWVHRVLLEAGIENLVVDSASIKVERKRRRAKSDRLDAKALVRQLLHWYLGEKDTWKVVRVPSPEEEDARQLDRSLQTVKKEHTRTVVRIRGLLASWGARMPIDGAFPERLEEARNPLGARIPEGLRRRIGLEYERLLVLKQQLRQLESIRRRELTHGDNPLSVKARKMYALKGIGQNGAWRLSSELFSWRTFQNRKELGSLLGLTPTPYQSGDSDREQGIGKDGIRSCRAISIELAWGWLRFQPDSELSLWFERRFGGGSKRLRKIGIVALARKLVIALWRWTEHDVLPKGAILNI